MKINPMNIFINTFLIFLLLSLVCCSGDNANTGNKEAVSEIEKKEAISGIRIAWDFNTKTLISGENDEGYNGYPRLIQLQDKSLLVVYESKGDVIVKKSSDTGENWSDPITIVENSEEDNMANHDVVQ